MTGVTNPSSSSNGKTPMVAVLTPGETTRKTRLSQRCVDQSGGLSMTGWDRKVVLPHTLTTGGEPLQGCGEMVVPTGMVTRMLTLTVGSERGNA